jgi:hypothetical protein
MNADQLILYNVDQLIFGDMVRIVKVKELFGKADEIS